MTHRFRSVLIVLLAAGSMARAQAPSAAPISVPDVSIAEPSRPGGRMWADAEYLLWRVKNGPTPGPLVTTGPVGVTSPGALGSPGTIVVDTHNGIDYKLHSGGIWTLGYWFDEGDSIGMEVSGLLLETHTSHFGLDSTKAGAPVIARPFFNVLTGKEDAEVITAPGSYFGGIDVFSDSRLWGGEANLVGNLLREGGLTLDALAGFRYLGLDESLRISQSSTVLPGAPPLPVPPGFLGKPVPAPDIASLTDRFETRNQFYGGQVGVRGRFEYGGWLLDLSGKVGLGSTQQWSNPTGISEQTDSTGLTLKAPGGLYAVGQNFGLASRDRFTFVSEAGVRVGYQFTGWLSASLGYDILYWDDVARPGDQMNRNLNPQLVPSNLAFGALTTVPQPLRQLQSSDYWAQGLTVGLTVRY